MSTTGGLAVPAVDRRAASVLDLTKNCLSKFDVALASQDQASKERLETRLADFNLWVSGVGAIAKTGLSLDSRLQLRPDDVAIVKSVLLMLSDSLEYYVSLSQAGKISHDSVRNIDSAIRNLALIGAAIRRTGKASRSRRADRTFNPNEHRELRKHLECVLLLRPTEEGRQIEEERRLDELDPSRLSGLQRRLIDANLRRRHQFLLAQRRSRNEGVTQREHPVLEVTSPVDETPEGTKNTRPDNPRSPKGSRDHPTTAKGNEPLAAPTISGFSRASTAEGSMKYSPAKPYIPGTTKTQITSIASDVEFPHSPAIPDEREIFQCPCCCQSLPVATFKDSKLWKRHIVEDLCPYTCIAENCPTPHLLFCTRSEWEAHVKKSHVPRWQCPFCAGDDAEQPSMEAMADHLQTRHNDKLSSKSLSALLSWSAVQTMGIKTCPFCSDYGPEDAPDLVDHVLQEAYDFALRALPWPKPVDHQLNEPPGLFKLPDKVDDEGPFGRWIREPIHVPEEGNHSELKLCPWDTADHSEPLNLDEYTDYFDEGGYFRDKHEGRSLAAQSRSSEAEPGDTVDWKAFEDEPSDTVDRETLEAEPGGTVHRESLEARLDVLYDGLGNKHVVDAEIDIVAVPGFNFGDELNHAEKTWTKDNKLWLRDVLPLSLTAAARVMLFAYDSCPSIGATAVDIVDHGRNLLQRLHHERVDAPERPVAFICHSLGGLVVKQALFEARASYDPVFEATCFLVFFGTPHRRGSYETVGHVAARISATAIAPSPESGADGLQEALKQNVNDTTTAFDRIGHLLFQRCAVINYFETRMTRMIGIVVDRNSATLGLSGAVETQMQVDADHSSLCKFDSNNYKCEMVCRDIAIAASLGLQHRGRRPLDQQTDAPATDSAAGQTEALATESAAEQTEAPLELVPEPQMEEDDFWGSFIAKKDKKKKKTRGLVGLDFEPQLEPEHELGPEPVPDMVPKSEEENDIWSLWGTKRGKETKNEKRQPGLKPDEPEEHAPEQSGEAFRQSSSDQPIVTDSTSADTERRLPQRPNSRDDFEIAIICALSIEANAVYAHFDHYWDDDKKPGYGKAPGDPNTYSAGVVGRHNVVLAFTSLMGEANAAVSAASCRMSFPNIKLTLIVGICSAVPFYSSSGDEWTEIVLGDVIVSDNFVQYDLRDRCATLRFDTPNAEIHFMLAKIRNRIGQKRLQEKMASSLAVFQRNGKWGSTYPGVEQDRLFDASYIHVENGASCEECGSGGGLLSRARLTEDNIQPAVHFGAVASVDMVIRSGKWRDDIAGQANVIGFVIEASGAWVSLPCVLIKGVYDYADGHTHDVWKRYAATTAAACMKAFLDEWETSSSSS